MHAECQLVRLPHAKMLAWHSTWPLGGTRCGMSKRCLHHVNPVEIQVWILTATRPCRPTFEVSPQAFVSAIILKHAPFMVVGHRLDDVSLLKDQQLADALHRLAAAMSRRFTEFHCAVGRTRPWANICLARRVVSPLSVIAMTQST